MSAKEFNDLGKILNRISDGTIGFASLPDGTGMTILNLSVYNTDFDDFIAKVREFLTDDESQRISEKMELDAGRARRTWTIGKDSGPAGYYSEGRYEELDEYDGLISYDEYRSYLSSKEETSEEIGQVGLTFERELSAKEFNDLGKILNEISDGTIGSASRPDGMGMDILNLSVYNTDYDDFIRAVEEFINNDETERISGKTRRDVGQARRTWTIGKDSGPAGYYSEGRYEELDEYDGLISYEEYRSYLSSKKETSEESGEVGLNPTPYTQTDPPSSDEEREERAESQESVPPVSSITTVYGYAFVKEG